MPYLTPDGFTGDCLLTLHVPNDRMARAAIIGQLTDLCKPEFWELHGSKTPQETAQEFIDRFGNLEFDCS